MLHPRYIEANNRIRNENLTVLLSYKYGDPTVLLFYRETQKSCYFEYHFCCFWE
jgi:hypothetical protein